MLAEIAIETVGDDDVAVGGEWAARRVASDLRAVGRSDEACLGRFDGLSVKATTSRALSGS